MSAPMESHCIPFREVPDTSKLFWSFLEDFSSVSAYYPHPPSEAGMDAAAREVRLEAAARRSLVDVLREQNQRFGADASTEKASTASRRARSRLSPASKWDCFRARPTHSIKPSPRLAPPSD